MTRDAAPSVAAFRDLGTLEPGAPADLTVLELRDGDFEFVDNEDAKRKGRQMLATVAVVMNGRKAM